METHPKSPTEYYSLAKLKQIYSLLEAKNMCLIKEANKISLMKINLIYKKNYD